MYIIISTCSDKKNTLDKISKEVIEKKYSPCIQKYKKSKSIYIWQNKIQNANEYKIDIKTHSSHKSDIVKIIKDKHNYETPEIICYEINILNKDYEKWFKENISK